MYMTTNFSNETNCYMLERTQPILSMQTYACTSSMCKGRVEVPVVLALLVGLPALLLVTAPAAADDWLSSLQLHALSAALLRASASRKPAAIQQQHPFSTLQALACFV